MPGRFTHKILGKPIGDIIQTVKLTQKVSSKPRKVAN